MIRLQQLHLMRGTKVLLHGTDLTVYPGEKVGLIGENGMGKSSLFSLLRGDMHPEQGDINVPAQWKIAHVHQETPALARSAIDYCLDGDVHLRALTSALHTLEQQPNTEENGHKMAELYVALQDADAYSAKARAEQLLLGLGFSMAQLHLPVAAFSGGWRMRLNLAQALMCPSDLLLLDEPTNHLDLDAIIWLEEYLKKYTGTLIIISHDRDFLDNVVNVIVHIDTQQLKRYSGHYSHFEQQRLAQLTLIQQLIEKQNKQREHLQAFIDRFKAKASKAKQAQSRMKALERIEALSPLRAAAQFSFDFKEPLQSPNPLLVLEDVAAGYTIDSTDKAQPPPVLNHIHFTLQSGQRIGLLGINGAGKSTLIKTLVGDIPPLSGTIVRGRGLHIGYFAQHQLDNLRQDESPLWHLSRIAPTTREQVLRDFLGGFHFPGAMASSPIQTFSGGEKARLALALIVWQRPNLLLLDEPTNHLDLTTREALTDALASFDGTLILVSHDRHLLRATTDEFMLVADGKVASFDGDLEDYKAWLLRTKATAAKELAIAITPPAVKRTPTLSKKNHAQKIAQLELRIAELEQALLHVTEKLTDNTLYQSHYQGELSTLLTEQTQLQDALARAEKEWEALIESAL